MFNEIVIGGLRLEQKGKTTSGIRLLCYFLHRWLDFRLPDVESSAAMAGCSKDDIKWGLPAGEAFESPFWYLTVPSEDCAKRIAKRSMLLKGFFEVWGEGSTWEELRASIDAYPSERKDPFLAESVSYRFNVDTYGKKASQEEKVQIMHDMDYVPMEGKADLKNPDVDFWLIICQPDNPGLPTSVPYRLYFGREVALSDRSILQKYALPKRNFLGPTSMDAEMAFVMCNQAQVQKGHLVFDPFVGTGSILVAAAHYGAYTMGADIDFKLLKYGKQGKKGKYYNIWSNFSHYDLEHPLGLLVCDVHRLPLRMIKRGIFDAILCDPPYGVRAGGKKLGKKKNVIQDRETHIPHTTAYTVGESCKDLLDLSARLLRTGGRLVYFLPATPETYSEEEIPRHPMLELQYNSEQILSSRYSRRLITMQKTREYNEQEVKQFHEAQGDATMAIDRIHELVFSVDDENGGQPETRIPRLRGKHY